MNQNQLKILQECEKDALAVFYNYCKNNDISFFLRGGSVLGAIKYKDIVPWDDDIDVLIPRNDYDKLLKICDSNISDKYLFISYKNTKNAHCYFPRILLKENYRKQYNFPKNNERGLVLIDVLPLDGMPKNKLILKVHIFKAKLLRLLASIWTYEIKETVSMHSSSNDKIIGFLHKVKIHRLYKQDTIYQKMDKLYSKYVYGKTYNAGTMASSKMEKEIMEYSIWDKGTTKKFGDMEYLVPLKYDLYLKKLFGEDYMTREPSIKEKNKSHILGSCNK